MGAAVEHADALDSGAIFSPDRTYRYLLWRRWDPTKRICAFIGLNPSTADETDNDPTVRRCIRFARDWGYGTLWMLNAYAFRATDPKVMKRQFSAAVGPQNDQYILQARYRCGLVIAAWGVHCDELRERSVMATFVTGNADNPFGQLCHLGLTKDGHPKHPLYLRADTEPQEF